MTTPREQGAAEAARGIANVLAEAKLPYAIGGALALAIAGVPRGTADVDVNVFVSMEHLPSVIAALRSLGIEIDDASATARAKRDGMFVGDWDGMRIDVFLPSIPFSREAERTRISITDESGWTGWFLSAEALTVFKLLFFRSKDLADLERLVAVRPELCHGDEELSNRSAPGGPSRHEAGGGAAVRRHCEAPSPDSCAVEVVSSRSRQGGLVTLRLPLGSQRTQWRCWRHSDGPGGWAALHHRRSSSDSEAEYSTSSEETQRHCSGHDRVQLAPRMSGHVRANGSRNVAGLLGRGRDYTASRREDVARSPHPRGWIHDPLPRAPGGTDTNSQEYRLRYFTEYNNTFGRFWLDATDPMSLAGDLPASLPGPPALDARAIANACVNERRTEVAALDFAHEA